MGACDRFLEKYGHNPRASLVLGVFYWLELLANELVDILSSPNDEGRAVAWCKALELLGSTLESEMKSTAWTALQMSVRIGEYQQATTEMGTLEALIINQGHTWMSLAPT